MRLVTYRSNGHSSPGIVVGDGIVDATSLLEDAGRVRTTRDLIALGPVALKRMAEAAAERKPAVGLSDAVLGPPVPDPGKIVCLGLNYHDHAQESGLTPPASPMFFAKWANSLVGPTDPIRVPEASGKVDYEAELAVVIGTRCKHVDAADAMSKVVGAMAFNDVSARDLQLANPLWTGGKAIDTFGPCGPALVTLDELGDPQQLGVQTRVNGVTVQDGHTSSMIFGIAETIAFLSRVMTLEPGDIIATGTPAGVGQSRDPQLFLTDGDLVEVSIEGIGTLRSPVQSEASEAT